MTPGPHQLIIVLVLFVLLFGGRGRISNMLGDIGKGISAFKNGLNENVDDFTSK